MQINEFKMQNQNNLINIQVSDVDQTLLPILNDLHVNYIPGKNATLIIDKAQLKALLDIMKKGNFSGIDIKAFQDIYDRHEVTLQGKNFNIDLTTKPAIMGILNTSPDSFFDGSKNNDQNDKKILNRVEEMLENNAAIIDIGGQSTRPGYQEITPEKEMDRTIPYIKMIKKEFPEAVISVDSYKSEVIKGVLDAGADIINDINGFEDSEEKLNLVSEYRPGLIVMHNDRISDWGVDELKDFFINRKQVFSEAGINTNNWVIDPGVGFLDQSDNSDIEVIQKLRELSELDIPTLIAISRKSMFKRKFGIDASQNIWSTLVGELMMIHQGGHIIRAHDVKETNLMLKMYNQMEMPKGE